VDKGGSEIVIVSRRKAGVALKSVGGSEGNGGAISEERLVGVVGGVEYCGARCVPQRTTSLCPQRSKVGTRVITYLFSLWTIKSALNEEKEETMSIKNLEITLTVLCYHKR